MKQKSLTVPPTQAGMRLDVTLARSTGRSRNYWQHQLKTGRVTLNGASAKPNVILNGGDIISWEVEPQPSPSSIIPDLAVIYEDQDILIITKPSGILTHGTASTTSGTVADF